MQRNFYLVGWNTAPVSQNRVTNWRQARRVHLDDCLHLKGLVDPAIGAPTHQRIEAHMEKVCAMRHAPLADIESPSVDGMSAVWKVAQWSRHQE